MSDVMVILWDSIKENEILFFPFEMLSAALVFSWPLKRRSRFLLRILVSLPLCFVLSIVCMTSFYQVLIAVPVFDAGTSVFWCASLFLLCVVFVWCNHETRLWEAVYCAACAYLMEHLAYCVRILCRLFLPESAMESGAWGYFLSLIVIYGAAYLLFARQMIQDGSLVTTARESLALTLVTLTMVIGMSLAASAYQFETAHAVYASFCCVAVLFGQLKQQKQIKYQSELALQRQMWSVHKTQYEMSRESIEIINRKCHDLKYQVAALKHIHDPEQRSDIIDSLQSSVMIYDAALETGNEILDTVLTEKSLICGKHEIALSCIADGKQLTFLDPVDLYTLVGNALDNAIEATADLPAEERFIRMRVKEKAGLIFLQVENPYRGTLRLRDGLPMTHKNDQQNHGFGLRSIRDIGEKYRGLLSLKTENNQFVLLLTFPVYEQQFTIEN